MGLGTVWDGLARWAFTDLMPEFSGKLGIPEDHTLGYVMDFGRPAVGISSDRSYAAGSDQQGFFWVTGIMILQERYLHTAEDCISVPGNSFHL